jgi:glucose-1-phosphate thymidylyltransferase
MLEVGGVPVIRRNVELMRDQLDIRDIRVVIGHQGDVIREHLGDGASLGVRVSYVSNPRLDLELSYSIHLATRDVNGFCCVILADECYIGCNHRELLSDAYETGLVTCAVIASDDPGEVRKNYAVDIRDGRIVGVEEKPQAPREPLMGTGTYVLHPDAVERLRAAFTPEVERGPRDWTAWIGEVAAGGGVVRPFHLRGGYVNINSREDLERANRMWEAAQR